MIASLQHRLGFDNVANSSNQLLPQEETNQPNGFLKEVLQGIAVMQRKGLKKGSYELKPEFAINKTSS